MRAAVVRRSAAARSRPTRHGRTSTSCCSPATLSETVTVTASRTEQRLGDVPASVNVLERRRTSAARRPSSPTTCCGRFRRSACSAAPAACRRIRPRRACRCAASGRAASAARSCCSTACRSTIRSAAGCTGRACRSRAPTASRSWTAPSSSLYGNYAMGGVINIVTAGGDAPHASRSRRSTATAAARRSTSAPATSGARSASSFDGSAVRHRRLSDRRRRPRARARRQQRDGRVPQRQREGRLRRRPTACSAFVRAGLLPRGARQRQGQHDRRHRREERHELDVGERRRPRRAARRRAISQATRVHRLRDASAATSSRCRRRRPPRSIGRMTLNQRVPTNGVGGMVQWSRAFGGAAVLHRRHRLALGGRRQRGGRRSTRSTGTHGDARSASRAARSAASASSSRTSSRRRRRPDDDAQRPGRSAGATTTATTSRPTLPTGAADGEQRPGAARSRATPSSARASRRCYHLTDRVSVWGDIGCGLPRADAQRAVSPVPRRHGADAGQQSARTGAAGRRRARRQRRCRGRTSRCASTWFDNRVEDPVSNVTLTVAGANVTQQRQNLGRTRICGLQTDVEVPARRVLARRRRGYLYEQAKVTRVRGQPGAGRQVPAAGAEASRLGAGRLRQPAVRSTSRSRVQVVGRSSTTT